MLKRKLITALPLLAFLLLQQPTFDADGFVIDPATLTAMKEMVQEVTAANQMTVIEANVA